jgi:hypothetical protein
LVEPFDLVEPDDTSELVSSSGFWLLWALLGRLPAAVPVLMGWARLPAALPVLVLATFPRTVLVVDVMLGLFFSVSLPSEEAGAAGNKSVLASRGRHSPQAGGAARIGL